MIANYHTHTPRCNHAVGTEEEYARQALQRGLRILGFSDHAPQWFPGDYYSTMRMRPEQLEDYTRAVEAVRQAYANRLEIHLGMEAEYYPAIFGEMMPRLRDAGVEYMILGQHWIGNEIGQPHNVRPTGDESHLKQYCHQVMEAMQTGLFTYIAHPDLMNFVGDLRVYERYMRQLCREARQCRIPLEINLLGIRENRHYPADAFWRIAGEEGCWAILGSDAHESESVYVPDNEKRALQLVRKYGLPLLETVQLQRL